MTTIGFGHSFGHVTIGKRLSLISVLLTMAIISVSAMAWHALTIQSGVANAVYLLSRAQNLHQDSDMMHDALKSDLYAFLVRDIGNDEREEMKRTHEAHARKFRDNMTALAALPLNPELSVSVTATRRQA